LLRRRAHGATGFAACLQQINSLAVLPLEDLARDPDQEYFADGMTDERRSTPPPSGTLSSRR
jgi:TolB-like protein